MRRLTSVISINAALSASVVLASRLHDDSSVFALILFSLLVFGQLPMLRNRTRGSSSKIKVLSTVGLSVTSMCLASCVSTLYALLSGIILLFVTFGVPQLLVRAQRFKK
jgi:phosphatidylinositol N-acetylglucosaminyltransferase subunit C